RGSRLSTTGKARSAAVWTHLARGHLNMLIFQGDFSFAASCSGTACRSNWILECDARCLRAVQRLDGFGNVGVASVRANPPPCRVNVKFQLGRILGSRPPRVQIQTWG